MTTKHKLTKPNFDLDNYINWDKIAKDYSLESGDISLHDTLQLEGIFYKFIETNQKTIEIVSNCCGAYSLGHVCSDNLGICPQCLEHCEFEKES